MTAITHRTTVIAGHADTLDALVWRAGRGNVEATLAADPAFEFYEVYLPPRTAIGLVDVRVTPKAAVTLWG